MSDERDGPSRLLHDVEVVHHVQLAAEKNKRGKAFNSQIDFVFANVVSAYTRQKQAKQQLLQSANEVQALMRRLVTAHVGSVSALCCCSVAGKAFYSM